MTTALEVQDVSTDDDDDARAAERAQRPDLFEDPTPCSIVGASVAIRRHLSRTRGWNANRKRWEDAVAAAAVAGVEPPAYDIQTMGPIPAKHPDPRGGVIEVHTLGAWRTWAHRTGRVDGNGDRVELRSGPGGAGRDNTNRADVVERRELQAKFVNAYRAARAAGAGREKAVEIAREQCDVGNGTAWRMIKKAREEAAAGGNPLD